LCPFFGFIVFPIPIRGADSKLTNRFSFMVAFYFRGVAFSQEKEIFMSEIKKRTAIIGGGIMGGDIAMIFCAAGWPVYIVEPLERVRETLPDRVHSGLQKLKAKKECIISTHPSLEDLPWDEIEIVIECVPERLDLKREVFAQMEKLSSPQIPLTSNSSSFPISTIANGLNTQSRMLGLHFFLPAHLAPLVEVICGEATDSNLARKVYDLMRRLGKKPVLVKKDIPGFLANRIQHALMREALSLVEKGIATPEDVDDAVRYGFGFRYIAAGPLRQKDLTGLDTQYAAGVAIYPDLCNDGAPSPYISEKVARGDLGIKTRKGFYEWTDEKIAEFKTNYENTLQQALEIMPEG
jgi:3-hydroxybutyryl-CoA dehydrogenase